MRMLIRLAFVTAWPALAQTAGGASVDGIVRDKSGGSVAGALVTLTEDSKGLTRQTQSDRDGSFLFPAVVAGSYSVSVKKQGFDTQQMHGLMIAVGEQASVAIRLELGGVRTTVTVRAPSATDLDSESNTIGSVVHSAQVQELPLNRRSFLQLSHIAADSVELSPSSNLFSSNVGPPDRTIVLPGTLPNSMSYSLNGINITGSRDGELAVSPSVAAVDQFKVQMNFLMPEQGISPAAISIVTKSGTNQLHGEVFEFVRNSSLDARSFFAAGSEQLHRNQFGVASGGPLLRNRVWFHAFYEGVREMSAFSAAGYSPTQEMFAGNFASTGRVIYDPATYNAAGGTRTPFPNDVIPASQINPVSKNLLNYYLPGSSLSSIPNNIEGNPRNILNEDQGGLRLDAAPTTHHQLFAQIFREDTPLDQPGLYPLSGLRYQNGSQLVMVEDIWTVSPRAVQTLRAGFLQAVAIGGNEAQSQGSILPSIGITNTFEENGVTAINLQGYSSFGRSNGEVGNRDNTWQIDEEFSTIQGRHSLAVGMGLRYRRGWHLNGNSTALGQLSFQPTFTARLSANAQGQLVPLANTGDSFADFLLGMPVSGTVLGLPEVQYRATQINAFLQDSWKLTSNLTLNYGLSWLLDTPPNPQGWARNYVHGFDTRTGQLIYSGLGQMSPQAIATDWNNFAPRLGVAWKPSFLKDTVVRAGAGTYYSHVPWFLAPYSMEGGSPVGSGVNFTNLQTNPLPTYLMGVNIFPATPGGAATAYPASVPSGSVVAALNPNFRTAYVNQWNLSLQHGVGRDDLFELTYLGSSGHRLPNIWNPSQCQPASNLFCDLATRPFPNYGLLLYGDSTGNSSYEGLIAKYDHRVPSGLNLHIEYAIGKALADTYQAGLSIYNQVSDCRRCSKGPTTFDVRHRLVGSMVWDLPFGRGQRFGGDLPRWLNSASGGWTLTAVTTFSTGQPVTLSAPNQTGSSFITPLPNRVCDGRSDQLSSSIRNNGFLWFNTACFPVPPVGYFGNSGPTVLYGPGLDNWDVGVEKSFVLSRNANRLQLRAEMFNTWNHAQFEEPNGNAGAGANFGRISASLPPRLIQVAMKIYW